MCTNKLLRKIYYKNISGRNIRYYMAVYKGYFIHYISIIGYNPIFLVHLRFVFMRVAKRIKNINVE